MCSRPCRPLPSSWCVYLYRWQVGKQFLVDASHEEEACAECRLTMAVNRAGQLCGVVKEGEGTIPWEQYLKAVKVRVCIYMYMCVHHCYCINASINMNGRPLSAFSPSLSQLSCEVAKSLLCKLDASISERTASND